MGTDQWIVRVVVATAADVRDTDLDTMADAADARGATVARRADRPGVVVTFDVAADDGEAAVAGTVHQALELVGASQVPGDAVPVDIRAMTVEAYESEALRADIPELVGAADAAGILGVSRQRVHQLAKDHPRFPAPVLRPASGPLWTRDAVEWFDSVWERRPGRPATRRPPAAPPP